MTLSSLVSSTSTLSLSEKSLDLRHQARASLKVFQLALSTFHWGFCWSTGARPTSKMVVTPKVMGYRSWQCCPQTIRFTRPEPQCPYRIMSQGGRQDEEVGIEVAPYEDRLVCCSSTLLISKHLHSGLLYTLYSLRGPPARWISTSKNSTPALESTPKFLGRLPMNRRQSLTHPFTFVTEDL